MVELAKTLMEVETLDREEFENIMNKPGNGQLPEDESIADGDAELAEPLIEESTLDKQV
jgi:hypothetical protein